MLDRVSNQAVRDTSCLSPATMVLHMKGLPRPGWGGGSSFLSELPPEHSVPSIWKGRARARVWGEAAYP